MNDYDIENQNNSKKESEGLVHHSLAENKRLGFVRKVYSILTVQLLFTTLFTVIAYQNLAVQLFLVEYWPLMYVFLIVAIVIEIAVLCYRSCAREYPRNYVLLGIFTFCFSYIVATICSAYFLALENGAQLVLTALVMTLGMTFALTLYACTTKTDITMCGSLFFIFGVCLFFFAIALMFTNNPVLNIIYCILAIILYSLYIIYDTQLIMGGKQYELSLDDYVIGALILYIDIIMLFLELLQLLGQLFGK